MWDNGYTQVFGKPTRGDSLLDVYLVRPESTLISCGTAQGVSEHCGVLLYVECVEKCFVAQEIRIVLVYHKTNVLGLQHFLREELPKWANMRKRHMEKFQGHSFLGYQTFCSA